MIGSERPWNVEGRNTPHSTSSRADREARAVSARVGRGHELVAELEGTVEVARVGLMTQARLGLLIVPAVMSATEAEVQRRV